MCLLDRAKYRQVKNIKKNQYKKVFPYVFSWAEIQSLWRLPFITCRWGITDIRIKQILHMIKVINRSSFILISFDRSLWGTCIPKPGNHITLEHNKVMRTFHFKGQRWILFLHFVTCYLCKYWFIVPGLLQEDAHGESDVERSGGPLIYKH